MSEVFVTRVHERMGPEYDGVREDQFGGDRPWYWAAMMPFRATLAPEAGLPMPQGPQRDQAPWETLGYWNALSLFLTYSFGWRHHERGLRAWVDAGKPCDDVRFAIIRDTWDRDGSLLPYIDWCRRAQFGPTRDDFYGFGNEIDALSDEWIDRLRSLSIDRSSSASPHSMHLQSHFREPALRTEGGTLHVLDAARRSALVMTTNAIGWYQSLSRLGATLPDAGRHWHVDVVARPLGRV